MKMARNRNRGGFAQGMGASGGGNIRTVTVPLPLDGDIEGGANTSVALSKATCEPLKSVLAGVAEWRVTQARVEYQTYNPAAVGLVEFAVTPDDWPDLGKAIVLNGGIQCTASTARRSTPVRGGFAPDWKSLTDEGLKVHYLVKGAEAGSKVGQFVVHTTIQTRGIGA
jgi:hypothetical protein